LGCRWYHSEGFELCDALKIGSNKIDARPLEKGKRNLCNSLISRALKTTFKMTKIEIINETVAFYNRQ
jgi:hypothetical protein